MATGKRYYWIKLKDSFMQSDTVDYLMSQPYGANYVVIYQMLCLKTINTEGRLSRQIGEVIIPYDVEKIQRDLKYFSADTIRVALNLFKAFGLIYEDIDGTLVLAKHAEMVGSETDYARQKKNQRLLNGNNPPATVDTGVDIVHTEKEIRERDKEKEIRDKDTEKKSKKKADAFSELAGGDTDLLSALRDFETMRNKIKHPLTDRAKTILVNKLKAEFDRSVWIDVLEQSIEHSWQTIYPLDRNGSSSRTGKLPDYGKEERPF